MQVGIEFKFPSYFLKNSKGKKVDISNELKIGLKKKIKIWNLKFDLIKIIK
jgi:hypothetical protein